MIKNNVFYFDSFLQFPNLTHAVSTRFFGSMKEHGVIKFPAINSFLTDIKMPNARIVLAEQIHGGVVEVLNEIPGKKIIPKADSLITAKKNIILGVLTADCLPVLFYDRNKKIIGASHAGFKGLSKLIIKHVIDQLKNLGSNPKDIVVCIGPGIGACCYTVSKDRIDMFKKKFPLYNGWYREEKEQFFLDLKKIARLNLEKQGILSENIYDANICTYDHSRTYFSYRKEKNNFGEFISIIGMK